MNKVNFCAIDIGSNAVKLLIKGIDTNPETGEEMLSQQLLVRVPIRLGEDAFTKGEISKQKNKQMILLMKSYKQLMKLYKIEDYRACATSAMRDASNAKELVDKINKKTGIDIEIIKGKEEARIIFETHADRLIEQGKGSYLYVDVGGGSTQVSLIHDCETIYSHSYNIGTVRTMEGKVKEEDRLHFRNKLLEFHATYPNINLIGSGGNVNKLYRLIGDKKHKNKMTVDALTAITKELSPLTVEERMKLFKIKKDRADVIVIAANIFLEAANLIQAKQIIVPTIGLTDGIIENLYEKYKLNK